MANPYEPPMEPLKAYTSPGLRWHLIPSGFLIPLGTLLVVLTIMPVVVDVVRTPNFTAGRDVSWTLLGKQMMMGTAGGLWIASGALFSKRRWWIAVSCLLVGYALAVLGASLR